MIQYCDDRQSVSAAQLKGFFVGWAKPLTAERHYQLLCGSTYFVTAVDSGTNQAVGFVTALSDGVNSSFIPLLEVLPEYREQGIGTELMRRILDKLDGITNVDLTCDAEIQPFYERFKMLRSNGMVLRKYLDN